MSERLCGALGCSNTADVVLRHESGRRVYSCRECVVQLHPDGDGVTVEGEV